MISKQVLLGAALALGGGIVFFALAQNDNQPTASASEVPEVTTVAKPVVQPLTADVSVEERVLAQKQQERAQYTQQMQAKTETLLAEQERARLNALNKASAEQNGNGNNASSEAAAKSELIAMPTVQTRPEAREAALRAQAAKKAEEARQAEQKKAEAKQAETVNVKKTEPKPTETKAKTSQYQVKAGETLLGIANRHGVTAAALAQANNMGRDDVLREGKMIIIPAANKEKTAQAKAVKKAETAQKSDTAKKSDSNTQNPHLSGRYTVQVAISPDKEKVSELVKKYKDAGYQVSTSSTSRGIRVIVGNEKTAEGAKALKSKIDKDARVNSNGAFIHQVQ